MITRLSLIRHGETEWNAQGRYQGQSDPPLNTHGLEQARQLADKLVRVGLDVLYSSTLQRALKTAKIIAEELNIPIHTDDRFVEINLGKWEGLLASEIAARYPDTFHRWETSPWTVTPPGGENLTKVMERVYAAADDILSVHKGRSIGLISHQLPLVMLKIRYHGIDPALIRSVHLPNTHWEEITLTSSTEVQDE